MPHKISIVIPVINEAQTIDHLLQHLDECAFAKANIAEIIIVDGGSTDGTKQKVHVAKDTAGIPIKLVASGKGRALQMNNGATQATGNILYFLHADSYPPQGYDKFMINQVIQGNLAGCFKMRFDSSHWWLKLAGWLTQFKWRACRGGDQSQFITKEVFEALGGFDERFIIYEDNDLINKLYARRQFVVIQEWLTTSARRYDENGVWRLQFHFWSIYVRKWFGASADELHSYYLKKIS